MKKMMLSAGVAALLAVAAFPAMADEAAPADTTAPASIDSSSIDDNIDATTTAATAE